MSRSRWCLIALSALTPISVQVHTEGDTSATITMSDGTRVEVYGGAGEYSFISRGCEGVVSRRPVSFHDVGGGIEQALGKTGLSIGVRGGWMRDDIGRLEGGNSFAPATESPDSTRVVIENRYVNPYITYEKPRGSVGLGWVAHDKEFITAGEGARQEDQHPLNDFSGHLRIGPERHYFAVRWMESVPIYSGGGYLTIGVGGRPANGRLSLYGGMGAGGPYEGAVIMLQAGYPLGNHVTVGARTRLGWSGDRNASGVALGVGYHSLRP